ncbi:MAG TPA: branched-chain amino acid transferase [Candidatus Thioglobus sp.]|nr:branched-chain amino acid transferase [Candidatus Thioglobus sp.]HIL45089.1 branched-chain amino acid transferase [Candidatus Thioglobus sp.]
MKEDIFPKGAAWMNGEFIQLSEARIPVLDWGFLRSDATYDVVHVWKGRFFRLDKHIDRFFESTEKLRMPCAVSRVELKKILAGCVDRSGLDNAYVEMIQTRGMSPNFERDPRKSEPRFIAFAVPFGWILRPEEFEKGLDVLVSNRRRISPDSIDSRIKNYHWLDLVSGMYEAYDYGHDTVILTDQENNISEGPGFNIFCVDEAGLNSPKKGVLKGITRQTVLDLAKELNLPFQLSSISLEKLKSANEVFATSTAGGIMPITKINGQLIGQGAPGEITRKLHKAYWDKHSDPYWSVSKEDLLK